ncbi:DUF6602 domain-containing protein [Cohnella faecalis]|uniref:DUF6602 domain-containing protein n=1 Tax=Cohnella faecalis TaxID=2315694 RepID=A0A398CXW3_9BACL|nr:DUF6602 domain-containing protein [Cohnella faecalis]RIE05378.1 hypothetical protein D3H35_00910 [Cohnella faecalis]
MNTEKNDLSRKKNDATQAIVKIKENYVLWEKSVVDQLNMSSTHPMTTGGYREEVWQSIFDRIVPRKFSVARSVFIIDSNGRVSNEVDLAIFDEQYTPYIFRNGLIKYIPIEAVAAAVQCKSTETSGADSWAQSITALHTSFTGISRMATGIACGDIPYKDETGNWIQYPPVDADAKRKRLALTQTATRPILILCHMAADKVRDHVKQEFDIMMAPSGERLKIEIVSRSKEESSLTDSIAYWLTELNHKVNSVNPIQIPHAEYDPKLEKMSLNQLKVREREGGNEISLLTLTFQLNQLLMLVNNPLLFPHQAYADLFNHIPIPIK